jgi:deoxyribose-phosphate aldolase
MTTLDKATMDHLVEAITQEILRATNGGNGVATATLPTFDSCQDCLGQCAQKCPEKIMAAIQAGAERFTANLGISGVKTEIAHLIDHTLLKPEATIQQIAQLCHEAMLYNFASVCVNPTHVKLAAQLLQNSDVKVCTVIGFPLGATSTEAKVFETQQALDDGATEIDMVIGPEGHGGLGEQGRAVPGWDGEGVLRRGRRGRTQGGGRARGRAALPGV